LHVVEERATSTSHEGGESRRWMKYMPDALFDTRDFKGIRGDILQDYLLKPLHSPNPLKSI
jgi:hypothetical protein